MKKKEFGPLYAKASNGKTKVWSCTVIEDTKGLVTLNVIHGYSDGKQTTDTRDVEPKNQGKLNETSRWEQGLSEGKSKENKKRDEGYLDTIEQVATTEIPLPMLAQKYSERAHYLKWPCYVQPKLNGVRDITRYADNGKDINHVSRKGKLFTTLEHINISAEELLNAVPCSEADGEIFHPEFTFQEIIRALKKQREETTELEYWVYDLPDTENDFERRNTYIKEFFDENSTETNSLGFRKFGSLVEVPTYLVKDEEEFKKKHKLFTEEWKFEGTILRNAEGKYTLKHRSNNLLKYKDFLDAEFKITGAHEGTGNDVGTAVFECSTEDGKTFSVRPKGSRKQRIAWFKDIKNLIGKELTVRYQNLSEDGTPIFPVGIGIRDYE